MEERVLRTVVIGPAHWHLPLYREPAGLNGWVTRMRERAVAKSYSSISTSMPKASH
jgi:hypothetical protein